MEEKEYLTIDETTEFLGFNRTTLYKYIKALRIETHKFYLDRQRYIAKEDVKRIQEAKARPWTLRLKPDVDQAEKPFLAKAS